MLRRCAVLVSLALAPALLPASDFDWLVREFSRQSGARQVHVPFFGLARFVVGISHPAGASDLHLAIFERGNFEGMRFRDLTDRAVGSSWKPMIRVRSSGGEYTNIYVREERKQITFLVTSLEANEATFVQVRLRPDSLIRFVDEHSHRR